MRMVTVDSSTLAKVGYDESHEFLQLEFCSGAVYRYFHVPAVVHEALLAAPSKGGYFNHGIRDRFRHRRLADRATSWDAKVSPAVAG